jgi:hypothetical protein
MGMKNPLIMNMEPGEEETMKAMTSSSAKMAATCEETEQVDEGMGAAAQKVAQTALDKGAEFMDTNPVGKAIKNVLKPVGKGKPTMSRYDQDKRIEAATGVKGVKRMTEIPLSVRLRNKK